jgi:hypothetical protein
MQLSFEPATIENSIFVKKYVVLIFKKCFCNIYYVWLYFHCKQLNNIPYGWNRVKPRQHILLTIIFCCNEKGAYNIYICIL